MYIKKNIYANEKLLKRFLKKTVIIYVMIIIFMANYLADN